ncbi:MAG: IS66 family insertion sequence element accessory protein TnpB [Lachnospiraceae bacterium]|nr:IS66 family insertion sequence element accessory protein TnpB [Lachnospiraceae bacterium]
MLNHFTKDAKHIYLALGSTDFRKQIHSLVAMVQLSFGKDPFEETSVFLFCNKRKDSIKVLCFDKNGFVLAQKKLLEEMKFRWPKEDGELRQISSKQLEWLLQ